MEQQDRNYLHESGRNDGLIASVENQFQKCTQAYGQKRARQIAITCTSGLVAMTLASHAEGRQFDPGLVYFISTASSNLQHWWLAAASHCVGNMFLPFCGHSAMGGHNHIH